VKDVGAAVDFILKRRGVQKLNLMGWSWGTSTMGWYTAQHNDKVVKLVFYAPQWLRNAPSLTDSGAKLGAYRPLRATPPRAVGSLACQRARRPI
jgi:pimeloyl-ACP methyl ester carboxylesterase